MKILIAGAGRLGQQAAHLLTVIGHQVTVIDRDPARLAELGAEHLHRVVRGDACEPSILESSGALTTDLLLASTGADEDNLVISLLAKRRFDVPHVFARINEPDNTWLFDARWGVDVALPGAAALVSLIEEAAGATDTIGLVRLASAGVTLIESHVSADSTALGRTAGELALPAGTLVAAIIRDGRPTVPDADYRFQSGDTVLVITTTAAEQDIHKAFHH